MAQLTSAHWIIVCFPMPAVKIYETCVIMAPKRRNRFLGSFYLPGCARISYTVISERLLNSHFSQDITREIPAREPEKLVSDKESLPFWRLYFYCSLSITAPQSSPYGGKSLRQIMSLCVHHSRCSFEFRLKLSLPCLHKPFCPGHNPLL